jgi:hypothetical protein
MDRRLGCMSMRITLSVAVLSLAACATPRAALPEPGWQQAATNDDRQRLRDWRSAFTKALAQARATNASDVVREGKLLDPDAGVGGVPIPDGNYRCRTVKVGAKSQGMLNYVAYPFFRCRVEAGAVQRFTKLTGSQRPLGMIYPADAMRQVFLGTILLGDETQGYQYGRDRDRDLAAWVERIGEQRWRMVFPYPHYESTLDVIELIPEN